MKRSTLAIAALAFAAAASPAAAQNEQFIPANFYWVGPYAPGGSGFGGGMIDYFAMINERDGGINGVKLTWEKCETEYRNDRGVECYERSKKKGPTGATVVHPLSTGITYSLIEKATADKIPVISMGYGRTDAADGRVFPYIFPLITTYWSQNTAKIKFIGQKEGGMDKLQGKKIVNIYHDSAYGKETIPVLDAQAKKYGFQVTHIAVPHPGNEQQSQWLQVRQIRPDWVILRGWGVMNPTALKAAAKVGFPRTKIVGVWWSGAEEDVIPAGDAAKGYIAAGFNLPGTNFPVMQDVLKHVYKKGKGDLEDNARVGSIYHTRGIVAGIITTEAHPHRAGALRQGQADDRRAGALGHRASQHRRQAPEGARRHRPDAVAQGLLHGPRRWRGGEVPAVGRPQVERDYRLDRIRPVAGAAHDRGFGRAIRQGEGPHAARLLQGEVT